ncbi:MAG TPA: pitrilysin family protein, partial [Kofleriaceae bacterium]
DLAKIARMMTRVMATVLVAANALSCNPTTPKFSFTHAEKRGRLTSNGLRFVVMPDSKTQLLEVDVRYEVGSREDPQGKAGLAHLAEHLMFQQKPDGPNTKPLFNYLLQTSVFVNAYTNFDETHYMVNARADQLDDVIKVEALRMHYGCETITEEEFLRERDVVRNEIRGRRRTAEGLIEPLTLKAIYPAGHAYSESVGGDDEQLTNISLKDACDFLKKYYVPERATVIVAGGVDPDKAIESIQKWFGKLEKRTAGPRRNVDPIKVARDKKVYDVDLERPWVTVSWALPDATTPEGEMAQFGIWSAFFDTAVKAEEYECATQTQPATFGGQYAPVFTIAMELKDMGRLDECLDFVWKAAKKAHRGWDYGTWEQLEEQKNRRKASLISQLEPLTSRTVQIGNMVQFSRDFDFDSQEIYIFHELDKIGKFDQERVGKVMKGLLDPDRARIVVLKPNKQGMKGDRRSKVKFESKSHTTREEPEVDPAEARRPLKVASELKGMKGAQRLELSNGMRVVMFPIEGFPVVSAQLIFDVGEAHTPDNPRLAAASANFLQLPMDAQAQARAGVSMRCGTTPDHTICTSRGMSIYLDVVIKGLERLIKAGEYNQKGIENWQKSTKIAYKLRRPQQRTEYFRQQLVALFGPDHPYTRTALTTPDAVGKVGRDALSSFRNKHYSAANATLVVVGQFDPKRAEEIIRENFGSWGKGHKDKPIARDPFKRVGPAFVGVLSDEDPQVDVSITYPAPAGIDGQEGARRVLNEMLNDKIWEIRSKLGSTYGTYSRRDVRVGPSSYDLGGAVDAPRAGESLKAMRGGIDSLRQGEDFEAAFARARRKVLKDLLAESTVTSQLASQLGEISRYGLDFSFHNTLLQQVAAVSMAQVRALLAKELDPANEIIVLLGDRPSVSKAFADAGIKDIKLIEPDYKE